MHVCILVRMCVYLGTYACTYARIYVRMHKYLHIYVYACMYGHKQVYSPSRMKQTMLLFFIRKHTALGIGWEVVAWPMAVPIGETMSAASLEASNQWFNPLLWKRLKYENVGSLRTSKSVSIFQVLVFPCLAVVDLGLPESLIFSFRLLSSANLSHLWWSKEL